MRIAPLTISAVIAAGVHLFPFRTEKLSPPAPMVLGGQPPGRVGRRRISLRRESPALRGFPRSGSVSPPAQSGDVNRNFNSTRRIRVPELTGDVHWVEAEAAISIEAKPCRKVYGVTCSRPAFTTARSTPRGRPALCKRPPPAGAGKTKSVDDLNREPSDARAGSSPAGGRARPPADSRRSSRRRARAFARAGARTRMNPPSRSRSSQMRPRGLIEAQSREGEERDQQR